MKRRDFIYKSSLAVIAMSSIKSLGDWASTLPDAEQLSPVMFVGHGNPMNAIEENEFSNGFKQVGKLMPLPKAIVCVSAHWETIGTKVTAMSNPPTIHDFGGFPEKLFQQQYPAPGNPELAKEICNTIKNPSIGEDLHWGLDHGTWSVLLPMFPKANIPVIQLSLDYTKDAQYHFDLAKQLAFLRKKGVMIIGSGNIVHNLGNAVFKDVAYDWTIEFDSKIKEAIDKNDNASLVNYKKFGKAATLAVPSNEHYLPLLYIAALRNEKDKLTYFNEKNTMGSISMRSVIFH